MTAPIPENGEEKPDNTFSFGNFVSGWPQQDESNPQNQRTMNQPQHLFQSLTGIRINMAGEVLAGNASGEDSKSSESELDSVEMGIIQEEKRARQTKTQQVDDVHSSPNSPHKDFDDGSISTVSDEEEARHEKEAIEILYEKDRLSDVGPRKPPPPKKVLKFQKCRFWKSSTHLLIIFVVIMAVFLFLAFWTHSGDSTLAWD